MPQEGELQWKSNLLSLVLIFWSCFEMRSAAAYVASWGDDANKRNEPQIKKSWHGSAFNFTSLSFTQMWLWVGISQEIAGGTVVSLFTVQRCRYQRFNNRKWLMMWWKLWTRINKTWKGTVWSVWSSEEEVCLCTSLFPEVMFLLVWSE